MDKQYSIFSAKTHFSSIIRQVRSGASFTITAWGQPVAVIRPIDRREQSFEDWVESVCETSCMAKAEKESSGLVRYEPKKKVKGGLKRFLESRD